MFAREGKTKADALYIRPIGCQAAGIIDIPAVGFIYIHCKCVGQRNERLIHPLAVELSSVFNRPDHLLFFTRIVP
jgi:hypothetical protein